MADPSKMDINQLAKSVVGLDEETGKAAAATVMLVNALNATLTAQSTMAKSFISTGRELDLFSSEVNIVGMNLVQSAKMFSDMNAAGIRSGREQIASMAGIGGLLGKNTKGMFQLAAFNEHALGVTGAQNAALIESSLELGAQFNVDSDKLVNAMAKLGQTLISAAATYGQQSSAAISQATQQLVAQLGTGAEGLITKVMGKIASGTAEAGKLAAVMGLDTTALRGTDATAIANLVRDLVGRAGDMVGGVRGGPGAEFAVDPLMKALGIDAGFLALSDRFNEGFQAMTEVQAETLREQILAGDINTSIAEMQKGVTAVMLPIVKVISNLMKFLVHDIGVVAIPIFSFIMGTLATLLIINTGILLWQKAATLIAAASDIRGAAMLAVLVAGGLIATGMAIHSSNTADNTSKIADESKAQTDMMRADRSNTSNLLSNMNNSLLAMLVAQELQLAELETGNQQAQQPVAVSITGGMDPHGSLGPSILGGTK